MVPSLRKGECILSAAVVFENNKPVEYGDVEASHAYKVLDSGVLQILRKVTTWQVLFEFGPHAWKQVSGTRFMDSTEGVPGTDGMGRLPADPMQVL